MLALEDMHGQLLSNRLLAKDHGGNKPGEVMFRAQSNWHPLTSPSLSVVLTPRGRHAQQTTMQ